MLYAYSFVRLCFHTGEYEIAVWSISCPQPFPCTAVSLQLFLRSCFCAAVSARSMFRTTSIVVCRFADDGVIGFWFEGVVLLNGFVLMVRVCFYLLLEYAPSRCLCKCAHAMGYMFGVLGFVYSRYFVIITCQRRCPHKHTCTHKVGELHLSRLLPRSPR